MVGLTIMVLFIPYAFASVIKQLQMEDALSKNKTMMSNNDSMMEVDMENWNLSFLH